MKEIVLRDTPAADLMLPEAALGEFRETRRRVARRSTIAWGEHCSECAFPSCYSSCEYYTPRPDLHCRRFVNGIQDVRIKGARDLQGLTQIEFRQWGKLEGNGQTTLLDDTQARRRESTATRTTRLLDTLPLPRRISSSLTWRLNERRKYAPADGAPLTTSNTAVFLIEAFFDSDTPINFTLTMMPWDKAQDGLFQTQLTVNPGYNRLTTPVDAIRRSLPMDVPYAIQLEVIGNPPDAPVVFGIIDFVELAPATVPAAEAKGKKAKTAKCVVWDLDDTVWTGTLVEDGIEGVQINQAAVEAMRMLDSRGILNSVASKNDEDLAMAALKHFGIDDLILFPQINWGPKSDSVRRIAETISIGLDTFVFVDDQPFERGEVAASHPDVAILTPDDISNFSNHPLFDVPATAESRKRREMYRIEEARQTAATSSGTDYLGFLRSCNITLDIQPVTEENAERIYELTQRTNQLNVTGARFTREEVARFAGGTHEHTGLVMRCRDNFGDYGIIGFCVLNEEESRIEAFFMSCRVQRKRVEHAFFSWLCNTKLLPIGATSLDIRFRKTAKNNTSVKMFEDLGFTLTMDTDEIGNFHRSLSEPFADADIVTINAES